MTTIVYKIIYKSIQTHIYLKYIHIHTDIYIYSMDWDKCMDTIIKSIPDEISQKW